MKSMTGYGKASAAEAGRTLTVELKTVNNRFLELPSRIPKPLLGCEDVIRGVLQASLNRGAVELYANYECSAETKRISVDEPLAAAYVQAADSLCKRFPLAADYGVSALMRAPEVVRVEAAEEDPALIRRLAGLALTEAAARLNEMRAVEGETVRADLARLIGNIESLMADASERAPRVADDYREKLRSRMAEILGAVEVDEARLLNEVAFFADKADVNEELSRLRSHIAQFRACLDSDEPAGRKLDFISQEINREINTMGSKSNDGALTKLVIAMKNELEKIKEQIRNVE